MKPSRYLVFALWVALSAASISQAGTFSLVGTGDLGDYKYTGLPNSALGGASATAKMGYGGGILIDSSSRSVDLQIGALYMDRKSNVDTSSAAGADLGTNTIDHHFIQIPVTLQFHLLPMVHLGLGGYYSHSMGSNNVTDSSGNASTSTDSALNQKSYDAGAQAGLGIYIPLTMTCHLLADGRYSYGLVNQVADGSYVAKTRDVQFMVGLTFGFMGGGRY